jgi:cytochrome c oxidase cbb3-type subunit 2
MARPSAAGAARGLIAIAATYVYFLLFAQFGFLALLRDRLAQPVDSGPILAAMGIAGLGCSLAAARVLRRARSISLIRAGFAGCAATALVAPACRGPIAFTAAAAAIGASMALLTVALASDLRVLVGPRHFGRKVGLGTGAAYLFCNLPGVFDAPPARQAAIVCIAATIGLLAVRRPGTTESGGGEARALASRDFRGLGFASIALAFLALVWIDSAAFAVIQETQALKGLTWSGPGRTLLIGSCHLLAGIGAGESIDRGRFRSLLLVTFALFLASFALLEHGGAALLAAPIYALGVSTYSVALCAYPSLHGAGRGLVPPRWRAGIVFGASGWIGSALGVGMARDLHAIPPPFLALAGAVLLGSTLLARRAATIRPSSIALGLGATALLIHALPGLPTAVAHVPSEPLAGDADRGRAVYLAEGCIHCHSQYVRPGTGDDLWWGPRGREEEGGDAPLIGTRRQGPDLSHVGNRRSPEWERQHLVDPRSVTPGSRMPSYGHLFSTGDRRGDDLVAYLASLGAGTASRRYEMIQAAPLGAAAAAGHAGRGAGVFARWCAPCHGASGRGDGLAATSLRRPSMNLRKDDLWLVSRGAGAETERAGLARLVRFGVPGTSMPGHEYLTDRQVADVTAYVLSLRGTDGDAGTE